MQLYMLHLAPPSQNARDSRIGSVPDPQIARNIDVVPAAAGVDNVPELHDRISVGTVKWLRAPILAVSEVSCWTSKGWPLPLFIVCPPEINYLLLSN
jgi:hypothetical protein